jgi:hypothetical protein
MIHPQPPAGCRDISYNGERPVPRVDKASHFPKAAMFTGGPAPLLVRCLLASVATTHLPPAWRSGGVGRWRGSCSSCEHEVTPEVGGPAHRSRTSDPLVGVRRLLAA